MILSSVAETTAQTAAFFSPPLTTTWDFQSNKVKNTPFTQCSVPLLAIFIPRLELLCDRSGGKANWHWLAAQGQMGATPEQMATCFTRNTTQRQPQVKLTPLSNNKGGKKAGSLGDPFSACSLFNYM